jgi:hypothetical protein
MPISTYPPPPTPCINAAAAGKSVRLPVHPNRGYTLVDAEVAERLAGVRLFERTPEGYVGVWWRGRREYLHRLVVRAPSGLVVHHRNFQRRDNRKVNLLLAPQSENALGRRKGDRPASSIFLGVRKLGTRNLWRAAIRAHGKNIHIGLFAREVEAALARDRVAREVHGVYARLNFPEWGDD